MIMEKQNFNRRFLSPVLIVFIIMTISFICYYGARSLENQTLYRIIAKITGTTYFLSVGFGILYVYTTTYIRGASRGERILASIINPFIWATKECCMQLPMWSVAESLYYYLNPLNFWLLCLIVLEMGIGTLIARRVLRKRGEDIKVVTPASLALIAVSLFLVIFAYAWGKGENLYVIFLKGYRIFFGTGV
jgi:hypothetical protein